MSVTTVPHYHSGGFHPGAAERVLEVPNPATGEIIGRVPVASREEVDAAAASARAAFWPWRATPVAERAEVMFRYKARLDAQRDKLARLLTAENGKPLAEAHAEVGRGIEVVAFASGMPTLMMGTSLEDVSRGVDSELIRVPVGVIAGICPFNFPAMIPLWMFPIAIAAGNAFILKPSELTPLTGTRLVELLYEAGLPPGVMNLVHGDREVVDQLLVHDEVDGVSFVGSQPVAEHIYKTASAAGKRVQAMAGAKNHLIVMPDAVLEKTVPAVIGSGFGSAGERCLAGSVVVAVGGIADVLVDRLVEAAGKLKIGDGAAAGMELGPVIRPRAKERIEAHIAAGEREGARPRRAASGVPAKGFFLPPVIFDHARPEMSIAREEIFGPVLTVIRVDTLEEAIAVANRSRLGNAAAIFTQSGPAARRFRYQIEAGMVGVNVGVPAPAAYFPFSGWKKSFYGDLHATGRDAVEFYTKKKVVTTRWF
jgi:malonate-semialdehyde dehydrogenase (acetylating)/methylmalonate-semialdehyde dehydrogenase